jgi:lipopolysaccharide export system permease protein
LKTLNRFIFKSYLPPFALTFVISVFILFMQFLWKWVDELVGKGLDWNILTELFSFAALSMVPLALPMAVLLSSLMTFGNLAEHYELAAMKSSGLSLMRVMRPLIVFTVIISIAAYGFSNNLLPYTNLKMLSTLFDIRQKKPDLNIPDNVFYNQIDGYTIRKHKSKDGKSIEDVMIYDHSQDQGNTALTLAKTGNMSTTKDGHYLVVELHDGVTYKEMLDQPNAELTHPFLKQSFRDEILRMDLSGFKMNRTNEELFRENQQMLNGSQLLDYIDTMKQTIQDDKDDFYNSVTSAYLQKSRNYWKAMDTTKKVIHNGSILAEFDASGKKTVFEHALSAARNVQKSAEDKVNEIDAEEKEILRYKIEFWRKFTLSFACLLMFFIGAPLGAIVKKGGLGMPIVIAVGFFIIFWVLSITGEKLSKEGTLPPEIGMWLGCLCYIPLAIWLTRQATAEASLFDTGIIRFFSAFRGFAFFGLRNRSMKKRFDEEMRKAENEQSGNSDPEQN